MGYGTEELYDLFGYKPKIEPQNVALVGVRDLDSHEKKFIKKLGVKAFTMREIDERGMREVEWTTAAPRERARGASRKAEMLPR